MNNCIRNNVGQACAAALLLATLVSAPALGVERKLTAEEEQAVQLARQTLQQQNTRLGALEVTSVSSKQWPDTSLGCRQPGASYAQVITEGYVVLLNDGDRTHEVRVAGNQAVICDVSIDDKLRQPRAPVRSTHLAALELLAREDLAKQLNADVDQIRVLQRVPKHWTESTLRCVPEATPPTRSEATIPGFKLFLRHRMRTYTYHTDDKQVFACPAIEQK